MHHVMYLHGWASMLSLTDSLAFFLGSPSTCLLCGRGRFSLPSLLSNLNNKLGAITSPATIDTVEHFILGPYFVAHSYLLLDMLMVEKAAEAARDLE